MWQVFVVTDTIKHLSVYFQGQFCNITLCDINKDNWVVFHSSTDRTSPTRNTWGYTQGLGFWPNITQHCMFSLLNKIAGKYHNAGAAQVVGGVGHMTVVIFNYTALKNKGGSRAASCSTAVSDSGIGRKGRQSGGKEERRWSRSHCHHGWLLFTLLHMQPSAPWGFFIMWWHVSHSWEVLSLSEEKATWLLLSEGEEGSSDRMVMCWTSSGD